MTVESVLESIKRKNERDYWSTRIVSISGYWSAKSKLCGKFATTQCAIRKVHYITIGPYNEWHEDVLPKDEQRKWSDNIDNECEKYNREHKC
jgi:hypothetical protein